MFVYSTSHIIYFNIPFNEGQNHRRLLITLIMMFSFCHPLHAPGHYILLREDKQLNNLLNNL